MSLFDESPSVAPGTFVAPCASVVGSVDIADKSSVWYGSVIRGDGSAKVSIGSGTNVQDMVVIKSLEGMPCSVGSGVTIGHSAVLTGCTVGDGSLVGMGAVIGTGAVVESGEKEGENTHTKKSKAPLSLLPFKNTASSSLPRQNPSPSRGRTKKK